MLPRAVYVAYFAGLLLLGGLYHGLLDVPPVSPDAARVYPWWVPEDLRSQWSEVTGLAELARSQEALRMGAAALLLLPPLALGGLGLWLFDRSRAIARCASLALALLIALFAYYGILAPDVWRFFHDQFVGVAAAAAATSAVALLAPGLLSSALRMPRWATALAGVAFAAAVFLPSTEITGADPRRPFGVSPWPALTLFGFLHIGLGVALLHLAAGIGVYTRARLETFVGAWLLGVALAGLVAAGGAALLFPLEGTPLWSAFGICAGGWAALGERAATAYQRVRTGLVQAGAGILLGLAILGSNAVAGLAQARARDVTAPTILQAIEAYHEARGQYPLRLDELVPEYLATVPQPRIGLWTDSSDVYQYASLGDSYALEFASVQFVECQYSSPVRPENGSANGKAAAGSDPEWRAANADEREAQARLRDLGLGGSWSCKRCPTKLW
jgi:hypothetical protein